MRPRLLPLVALAALGSASLSPALSAQACGITPLVESVPGGNAGALGALELSASSVPLVGQPFGLVVSNGPPGAHGCLLFSFQESALPFPTFAALFHPALPVSTVTFDLDSNGFVQGLAGRAAIESAYCGLTITAQAVTEDPSAPGGVGFSDALRVRVGDVPLPRFAYLHDYSGQVVGFLTDLNGVPRSEHPDSPFDSGGFGAIGGSGANIKNAMIEVDGYLYVANTGSHDVAALRIEPDGSLTTVAGSPFPSGGFNPNSLAAHPSGDWLYVANDTNGTLGILAIAADGSLSEAFPSVATNINGMVNIEMRPQGDVLWTSWRVGGSAGPAYNPLQAFAVGTDGNLTPLGPVGTAESYAAMALTPSGDHLFAVTQYGTLFGQPKGIFGFEVLLSPSITFPGIVGAPFFTNAQTGARSLTRDVAASVDGRFLFVQDGETPFDPTLVEQIHSYAIDSTTGVLTWLEDIPTPGTFSTPQIMEASGGRLYTAQRTVNTYAIDADGGLTYLGPSGPTFSSGTNSLGLVLVD